MVHFLAQKKKKKKKKKKEKEKEKQKQREPKLKKILADSRVSHFPIT